MREVDEKSLLLAMKSPVSLPFPSNHMHFTRLTFTAWQLTRQIFEAAVQWAMKADKTQFWRSHRSAKVESPRESMATVRQSGGAVSRARSEE